MLIDFRKLFPRYNVKPRGVLHIGANVGEEAEVYHEIGIEYAFFAEANPSLEKKLRSNVERFSHGYFKYYAAIVCLSDEEGEAAFNVANNAGQSSSLLELGTHAVVHPDVHYIDKIKVFPKRMDHYFEEHEWDRYDFLNIDVQGAELKVLKGMGKYLSGFKWAYLEVNKSPLYKGCALVDEIDKYMLEFGLKRVETFWVGNTGWGDALYVR